MPFGISGWGKLSTGGYVGIIPLQRAYLINEDEHGVEVLDAVTGWHGRLIEPIRLFAPTPYETATVEEPEAAPDTPPAPDRWYVSFREKGDNATIGGYFRAENAAERDELTEYLKACGFRVVYEPHPDNSKGA